MPPSAPLRFRPGYLTTPFTWRDYLIPALIPFAFTLLMGLIFEPQDTLLGLLPFTAAPFPFGRVTFFFSALFAAFVLLAALWRTLTHRRAALFWHIQLRLIDHGQTLELTCRRLLRRPLIDRYPLADYAAVVCTLVDVPYAQSGDLAQIHSPFTSRALTLILTLVPHAEHAPAIALAAWPQFFSASGQDRYGNDRVEHATYRRLRNPLAAAQALAQMTGLQYGGFIGGLNASALADSRNRFSWRAPAPFYTLAADILPLYSRPIGEPDGNARFPKPAQPYTAQTDFTALRCEAGKDRAWRRRQIRHYLLNLPWRTLWHFWKSTLDMPRLCICLLLLLIIAYTFQALP